MRALQRVLGVPRIGWMFVAPNLAILGAVHVPADRHQLLLRLHRRRAALSVASARSPGSRTSRRCSSATNYLDPSTCRKDLFWRAIYNTGEVRGAAGRR